MLINKDYDFKKNHGYFVHFNMLKDTLLKVGKIDTSTIAADVAQIDKVGITKDNAKISYINDSGQNETYTVNFFNEYVQDGNDTNRLVSQYFTYNNNSLFQITLNYENGQTKVINVPDEINKYIKAYFGTHITLNNNPVNSIAFSDNSFSVNSENESKSFNFNNAKLPQIYSLSIRFTGVIKCIDSEQRSMQLGLNIEKDCLSINGVSTSTYSIIDPAFRSPYNGANTVSFDDNIFSNEPFFLNNGFYIFKSTLALTNSNDEFVLNKNQKYNTFFVLNDSLDVIEPTNDFLQPSASVVFKDETNNRILSPSKDSEAFINANFNQNDNILINVGNTNRKISLSLFVTEQGLDNAGIQLITRIYNADIQLINRTVN